MDIGKRLARLESRSYGQVQDREEAHRRRVSQEVLRRLTDAELDAYEAALEAEDLDPGSSPVLLRVDELFEEVSRELEEEA